MKAQVCTRLDKIENHPLVYQTVDDPKPTPDQLLIKVKACGVCYSNLHMIEGEMKHFGVPTRLPIIPGHEVSGIVEEVGSGVAGFKQGDRVGSQVLWWADGTCEYCLTGREHLCLNKQTTGETVDGGYAEYMTIPAAFACHLPDSLGFEESAPLFCPGVTGYHAVKRARVRLGQKVAVIGVGGVGHMTLQFAKLAGAQVLAVDTTDDKLRLAKDVGADEALKPEQVDGYVASTGKLDIVFVHAPVQKAVDQATRIVKRDGIVLMCVWGNAAISFPEEYSVIGSVIGTRQDMIETLRIAAEKKVKVDWTAYRLSEAEDVLIKLKQGKIVGRAILIP